MKKTNSLRCVCVCVCVCSTILLFQSCTKNNPKPLAEQQSIESTDMSKFLSPDEMKSLSLIGKDY